MTFSFGLSAWTSPPFLSEVKCRAPIAAWLESKGAINKWRRQVDPSPGARSFRSPTSQFGNWVEVHTFVDGQADGYLISTEHSEEINWKKNCVATISTSEKSESKNNHFTDHDLALLMKENKAGIIYVWSPGMVYSMDFYPAFKAVAEKLKLPLTVLMDPYFDEAQAKKRAEEFKIPFMNRRVESVELLMRDIGTHYPETLVYSNGKLSDERIVGVMTSDVLEKEIKSSLKALR